MKWNSKHIFLSLLFVGQVLIVQLSTYFPSFIESYYSRGIYPYISNFLRILFGWIPYSVGDLLLLAIVAYYGYFFVDLIISRFKNVLPKVVRFLYFTALLYICFYWFWAFNYYRKPLAENLGYTMNNYSNEALFRTSKRIVSEMNEIHLKITKNDTVKVDNPYSETQMYKIANEGYQILAKDYPLFDYKFSSVKSSSMSLLQSYNGTSGYLNPLTGEAHVNRKIPKTGYPTTTCHEMAHQIGFAAENEANFIGFMASYMNKDLYFKYASLRMAYSYCISEVRKRKPETAKEIWKTVNKGIIKDYNQSYQFWQRYKNPFEPLIKKGYNAYLKANNQKNGIQSYNYVVDLLISYFENQRV